MPLVTISRDEIFDLAKKKDPAINPYKMIISGGTLKVIGSDDPPEEPKKAKAKPKAPPPPEPEPQEDE